MKKATAQKQYLFISRAGYVQNEYLVILNPHEELRKKITNAKEEFSIKFDAPSAKWGKHKTNLTKTLGEEMIQLLVIR